MVKWKQTIGDYDVDSGRYDIDYGNCQICNRKLYGRYRKIGLCRECEHEAKRELIMMR